MEIKRCENGHFYDSDTYTSCPKCSGGGNETQGYAGGTSETQGYTAGMDSTGATVPISGGFSGNIGDGSETMGMTGGNGFDIPGYDATIGRPNPYEDSHTQPINPGGPTGFTPVTGWLVCIDGPARGTDYRIRAGYNFIGRSEHMDVCIRGDNSISREKHATIAYDNKSKTFFVSPSDGKNIIYLNDQLVMMPQVINSHDKLTIGTTVLMFVPLCGKEFDWND